MGAESLKQALDDCVIDFDRRVLVTDLLQEYRLPYNEVNDILVAHITEQEKRGAKFEKRFLVNGEEEETTNEIYTVVKGESSVQEWLRKLKNAESALYSVEIVGGAKAAADIFKPMTWCAAQMDQIGMRPPLKYGSTTNGGGCNGDSKPKVEVKQNMFGVKKPTKESMSTSKSRDTHEKDIKEKYTKEENKREKDTKNASPETVEKPTTPEKQKSAPAKPINKKGIASFFGPSSSTVKSETKKPTAVIKPPTPKKMENFFKKSDKTAASTSKAAKAEQVSAAANTSVQLFSAEEDETEQESHKIVDVDTSDDELQLEALRRQCKEIDQAEADTSNANTTKRRRIIDSDDDEPEIKHEKKDDNEMQSNAVDIDNDDVTGKSETFLDDDGFVITIKSKKPIATKKPVKPRTPEKSPSKESNKKSTKATPKQTSKSKQGNIMSFFSKK